MRVPSLAALGNPRVFSRYQVRHFVRDLQIIAEQRSVFSTKTLLISKVS